MASERLPTAKQLLLASTANQEAILRRLDRLEARLSAPVEPSPTSAPTIED